MTRVMLTASNPGWEGTEAQIASLAAAFQGDPRFALHAALFRPGVLGEALAAAGVSVGVVPVRWQLDVGAVRRLARLLRERRIDVLHSHGYKANVIGALAARRAGVPAVVRTEHGLPEPFQGYRRTKMALYLWLDRLVGRHLTQAVIGVSTDVEAYARRRLPGVRVTCIRNGIDPAPPPRRSREEARRELELPAGAPLVGILGRLAPVKDHATFLRAARRIGQALPEAHFLLAGQGPLEPALAEQAARLGLGERVHFRYRPGGAQIILDALDALAFSSLHEGIPYALLEALRAGVPVVATAVGGLREVLTHGQDGLLVPAGEAQALADALLAVLRDPALAAGLRAGGRRTLEARFSLAHMREETAAVYAAALRSGRRQPSGRPQRVEATAGGRSA